MSDQFKPGDYVRRIRDRVVFCVEVPSLFTSDFIPWTLEPGDYVTHKYEEFSGERFVKTINSSSVECVHGDRHLRCCAYNLIPVLGKVPEFQPAVASPEACKEIKEISRRGLDPDTAFWREHHESCLRRNCPPKAEKPPAFESSKMTAEDSQGRKQRYARIERIAYLQAKIKAYAAELAELEARP